jgi:predicted nucleic acid-binding protein
MRDKIFIDTNILVYAIESAQTSDPRPQIARDLISRSEVVLSTQVLGEFYRATTSKRRSFPLTHEEAVVWIQVWKRNEITSIKTHHVDLALELTARYDIGYFDALILSAAQLSPCETVYSEDLNHGQCYDRVTVINPFM